MFLLKPSLSRHWSVIRSFVREFALVLFDSPLSESKVIQIDAKEVSYKALYEAPLTRKTRFLVCQFNLSLVFLVSGASYEASFPSVLFDFALRER